jgi:hypothetical protein
MGLRLVMNMKDHQDIQESLFDPKDDSRTITFPRVERTPLETFLRGLTEVYEVEDAYKKGEDATSALSALRNNKYNRLLDIGIREYVTITLRSPIQFIPRLMLFIGCPYASAAEGYPLDISFFPRDIDLASFDVKQFMQQVDDWHHVLNAHNYCVRYGSVYWVGYNENDMMAVIYSGRQYKESQQ